MTYIAVSDAGWTAAGTLALAVATGVAIAVTLILARRDRIRGDARRLAEIKRDDDRRADDRARDDELRAQDRARDDRLRREAAEERDRRDEAGRRSAQAAYMKRQLTQARLVRVSTPGYKALGKGDDGKYRHKLTFGFANYGDRPVLDVRPEVWGTERQDLAERPYELHARIVRPGDEESWHMDIVTSVPKFWMAAFRYRWTDADGLQWCIDQREQPEPLPYEGQEPRRY